MKDLFTLDDKCALITGGGTGIGLAISREFIDAGARVVITGRREPSRRMVARERGAILNITSMAALYALTKVAAYSASKTAVLGLTRVLAAEFDL